MSASPCWQDIAVRRSYVTALSLALVCYLLALSMHFDPECTPVMFPYVFVAVMLAALLMSAVQAALTFSDPVWLASLADLPRSSRDGGPLRVGRLVLFGACLGRCRRLLAQSLLVLVLIAPIYFMGARIYDHPFGRWPEDVLAVSAIWGITVLIVLMGTAGGACAGIGRRRWAAVRGVLAATLLAGLLAVAGAILGVMINPDMQDLAVTWLVAAVLASVALCPPLLLVDFFFAVTRMGKVANAKSDGPQLPPDDLEVAFGSVLRWRFWSDPILRAERKHLWKRERIAILALVAALIAGAPWLAFYCLGSTVPAETTNYKGHSLSGSPFRVHHQHM